MLNSRMPSIAVLEGSVYFCGGTDSNEATKKLVKWDVKNFMIDTELSEMNCVRFEASAIEYEGWIFVVGGRDHQECFNSMECYNSKFDEWTYLANMKMARFQFQLATLDGLIYAAGRSLRIIMKSIFFFFVCFKAVISTYMAMRVLMQLKDMMLQRMNGKILHQ